MDPLTPRRILAVVVLYQTAPADAVSLRTLLEARQADASGRLDLRVVVHDNTPGAAPPTELAACVSYTAGQGNTGLAGAYNAALRLALAEGYEWLLTLDQDTALPADLFARLLPILDTLDQRLEVAAVVPQIRAGGRVVSPYTFALGAWPRWFAAGFEAVPARAVYAFNSGSLLRVSALRQVGGYSEWFWLDNSDAWLFRQLSRFGKRVYVAGSIVLEHDFSMLNLQERMSPERYRTVLLAETAFWDLAMNPLAGLERTLRLAVRMAKHRLHGDSPELQRLTRQALAARLFRSRRSRVADWRTATRQRLGNDLSDAPLYAAGARPMVSVVMAAYNGGRFIEAQLATIVPQLAAGDEIVIVDDASRDDTAARVESVARQLAVQAGGPQVRLLRNTQNEGVTRTFEQAIRSATGDILFLSDDDDLWQPDKVHKTLAVFARRPEVRVVSTGLRLIDDAGNPAADTEGLLRHRSFSTGLLANLLHNQYQGSTMAFRATLIRDILPLPTGKLFLHDAWMGTRNTLRGGKAVHLDEPLLLYRRHPGNFSRRFSRFRQLRLRLQFVLEHLRRWFQHL